MAKATGNDVTIMAYIRNISKEQAALLSAGDYVRYVPIDEAEYNRIKALGSDYVPSMYEVEVGELRGY